MATLEAILSYDSVPGYEGRSANGAGNTNVGADVVSVSSPAPPTGRGGVYCLNLGEGKTLANASMPSELFTASTGGTFNIDTFFVRFSSIEDLDTHATTEVFIWYCENTAVEWKLRVYSTGPGTHGVSLIHGSTPTTTLITTSSPFSNGVWHKVTVAWIHSNSSIVRVFIDGTQELSTSGLDMLNTAGDQGSVRFRPSGQVNGGAPNALHTECYVWGFTHWSDSFAPDEVTDYAISIFRPFDKHGPVSDCDESGNVPGDSLLDNPALSDGSEAVADDASTIALLQSSNLANKGAAWACDRLQGKAGPNGMFRLGATAIGCSWEIWYSCSTKGTANEKMVYGKLNGGTFTVNQTGILTRGTDLKSTVVEEAGGSYIPDIDTGYCVIGIGTSTNVNLRAHKLEEAWVDYLYEYPPPSGAPLTLQGRMTLNGSMTLCA